MIAVGARPRNGKVACVPGPRYGGLRGKNLCYFDTLPLARRPSRLRLRGQADRRTACRGRTATVQRSSSARVRRATRARRVMTPGPSICGGAEIVRRTLPPGLGIRPPRSDFRAVLRSSMRRWTSRAVPQPTSRRRPTLANIRTSVVAPGLSAHPVHRAPPAGDSTIYS